MLHYCKSVLGAAAVALTVSALPAWAENVLDVRLGARDIGSLDPAKTKTGDDEYVALQIFNSLVAPPRGTMDMRLDKLQPQLAESWDISDDKKTWTFHLRPGVQWQKGYGEVSAEDVKFSYERQLDPSQGGVHGGSFKDIGTIEVIDPLTVRFNLKQGNAFFHAQALTPGFGRYIVPKAAVEGLGDDFDTNPVGSGPFELAEYRAQEGITLNAHENYFLGRPPMDQIRFHYIPDHNAATIAFIGGELDATSGQRTTEWVEQVTKAAPDANLIAIQPGSLQFLHLNMTVPPLDDVRVRKALAHGIDRSAWGKVFGEVHGPLETLVPQSFYGAIPLDMVPEDLRYHYDPERAKALLAEAGFPEGFTIDAIISERNDYLTNMLMTQDMLRKIGVDINLQVQDHATYHANIREDKGTIVELSTGMAPTAPAVITEFLHSASAVGKPSALRNFSHYGVVGGSVDDLIEAAVVETDTEKQLELLYEAQLQIQRDVPVLPMQTSPLIAVMQGDIDLGYQPKGGFGQHEFATARRVKN